MTHLDVLITHYNYIEFRLLRLHAGIVCFVNNTLSFCDLFVPLLWHPNCFGPIVIPFGIVFLHLHHTCCLFSQHQHRHHCGKYQLFALHQCDSFNSMHSQRNMSPTNKHCGLKWKITPSTLDFIFIVLLGKCARLVPYKPFSIES